MQAQARDEEDARKALHRRTESERTLAVLPWLVACAAAGWFARVVCWVVARRERIQASAQEEEGDGLQGKREVHERDQMFKVGLAFLHA